MPYIQARDRTSLFYTDAGAGRPMVFVASAWLDSRMWEFQIPYLVDHGFRCIAYDRRGHGRSDSSWDGYDYDTLADDLGTLIDRLDLRDLTLVSHSAGSGEIVRYLTRHGSARSHRCDRVRHDALSDETHGQPGRHRPRLVEADLATRTADRPKWFADNAAGFFGVGMPGIRVSPEFSEFVIRQCLDCSATSGSCSCGVVLLQLSRPLPSPAVPGGAGSTPESRTFLVAAHAFASTLPTRRSDRTLTDLGMVIVESLLSMTASTRLRIGACPS